MPKPVEATALGSKADNSSQPKRVDSASPAREFSGADALQAWRYRHGRQQLTERTNPCIRADGTEGLSLRRQGRRRNPHPDPGFPRALSGEIGRSEERRVGKGGNSGM